jgi:hypothetical protein
MGSVLLAERGDDVFDKRVAIKVLRHGLEPGARERFALKRQALRGACACSSRSARR